jgi:hypothetical protein
MTEIEVGGVESTGVADAIDVQALLAWLARCSQADRFVSEFLNVSNGRIARCKAFDIRLDRLSSIMMPGNRRHHPLKEGTISIELFRAMLLLSHGIRVLKKNEGECLDSRGGQC